MTPDEGEEGGIWKWNCNCRDRCRSYVPDLFDRRLHNLVLVPAQLKHDGGSSSPDSADAAESMSFGATFANGRICCGSEIDHGSPRS